MITIKFLSLFCIRIQTETPLQWRGAKGVLPVEWFSLKPIWLQAALLLQHKVYSSYAPSPVKSSALLTWMHTEFCYPQGYLCSISFHWVALLWKKAASRWSYWTGSITNIVYSPWAPQVICFWLCPQVTLISCIFVTPPLAHPLKNKQQCHVQQPK